MKGLSSQESLKKQQKSVIPKVFCSLFSRVYDTAGGGAAEGCVLTPLLQVEGWRADNLRQF